MTEKEICIPVLVASGLEPEQYREICAGLEEEGVPFLVQEEPGDTGSKRLAAEAALRSPLQVGIGIDAQGQLCVHHGKLPEEEPYLTAGLNDGRTAGKNAARLVKGMPLSID